MDILTNANGEPFDKPEPPGPNASIETRLGYLEDFYAYRDAVSDCSCAALGKGVRKATWGK